MPVTIFEQCVCSRAAAHTLPGSSGLVVPGDGRYEALRPLPWELPWRGSDFFLTHRAQTAGSFQHFLLSPLLTDNTGRPPWRSPLCLSFSPFTRPALICGLYTFEPAPPVEPANFFFEGGGTVCVCARVCFCACMRVFVCA